MSLSFWEAIQNRRSYYSLSNEEIVSIKEIQKIAEDTLLHTPSAYNSQSTRIALLFEKDHQKLWQDIVLGALRKETDDQAFEKSKQKVENAFASGYGTALFFEDQGVVEGLIKQFPLYANHFPNYAQHTNGMHQLVFWTALEQKGLGASLQHYNPLIDDQVRAAWNIPANWSLIAQMPFGKPIGEPMEKTFAPLQDRLLLVNK